MLILYAVIGMIIAYVSARKWGRMVYLKMGRLGYIRTVKSRPPTPTLESVESDLTSSRQLDLSVNVIFYISDFVSYNFIDELHSSMDSIVSIESIYCSFQPN